MISLILFFFLQFHYTFLYVCFYVLSCRGILMNIFISLNNEITFFLEGEKHDLIRLPSQECFEYYHSQHQKDNFIRRLLKRKIAYHSCVRKIHRTIEIAKIIYIPFSSNSLWDQQATVKFKNKLQICESKKYIIKWFNRLFIFR